MPRDFSSSFISALRLETMKPMTVMVPLWRMTDYTVTLKEFICMETFSKPEVIFQHSYLVFLLVNDNFKKKFGSSHLLNMT